jgi:hypothetical protein
MNGLYGHYVSIKLIKATIEKNILFIVWEDLKRLFAPMLSWFSGEKKVENYFICCL